MTKAKDMRILLDRLDEGLGADLATKVLGKTPDRKSGTRRHSLDDKDDLSHIVEPSNEKGRKSPFSNVKEDDEEVAKVVEQLDEIWKDPEPYTENIANWDAQVQSIPRSDEEKKKWPGRDEKCPKCNKPFGSGKMVRDKGGVVHKKCSDGSYTNPKKESVSITQHQREKRYPKAKGATGKNSVVGHKKVQEKKKKGFYSGAWNKAEQHTKYDPPKTGNKGKSARRGFVG